MNSLRIIQVHEEAILWRDRNFPADPDTPVLEHLQDQLMGVVEEVGELSHCLLKQKQKIRGTYEEHEVAAKDAVGDIMVYLLGFVARSGIDLSRALDAKHLRAELSISEIEPAVLYIANRVGRLSSWTLFSGDFKRNQMKLVGEIIDSLDHLCNLKGWDLNECLDTTWAEVSQRDWISNKSDGTVQTTQYEGMPEQP